MAAPCSQWSARSPVRNTACGRPFNGIVRHRQMTAIDVFWIAVFVGGGAAIGYSLASGFGAIGGVVVGAILLRAVAFAVTKHVEALPPCKCGAAATNFRTEPSERDTLVYRCEVCRRGYTIRGGAEWFEVTADGTRILWKRRRLFGPWRPVDAAEEGAGA